MLDEFDEEIFNALVEKIEILTPTHFVFELKCGMKVGEVVDFESENKILIITRYLQKKILTKL